MTSSGADWHPYCGPAPLPSELLGRWNADPILLSVIVLLAFCAIRAGVRRAWVAASAGVALFLFVSPFCALTSALFSARVGHHVILTVGLAPILVLAWPRQPLRVPGSLTFWTVVQALVFWAWHSPTLYAAALSSKALYWLMQVTLLASAAAFWAALRNASETSAVAALLGSTVQMGLLGALITFASRPLYAPHFATTAPWGLAPLDDQQLAGLIMWVPTAGIYLGVALFIAHRWLKREDGALPA